DLRTELLINPIGIDVVNPRLSWKISSGERNVVQQSYHILVASSQEKLNNNEADLWDSGKQASGNSTNVIYNGKVLQSRAEAYWKVKVYTNKGESAWSTAASWTVGLMHYKDWTGRWIGFDRY